MTRCLLQNRTVHQSGMALIAVLWIVAALSILVTGMTQSVRGEVRVASVSRQTVTAMALGEAAVQLVLQELVANPVRPARLLQVSVPYKGHAISVQVLPLNGLIDINNAPVGLLTSLFAVAAQQAPSVATALAQRVVVARTPGEGRGKPPAFEVAEDLLRIPGLDYSIYNAVAKLVTAGSAGSGRVNPMSAPLDVLVVLADGNTARAAGIAAQRDAGRNGVDTTTLNVAYTDAAVSQRFRLQARVLLDDGGSLVVSQGIDLAGDLQDGLPWKIFNTEHRFESAFHKVN